MKGEADNARLIVNADDFAYFSGVSRGIIQAHRQGMVTATGIIANTDCFDRDVDLLTEVPTLDVGVHLNLTFGSRLTKPPKNLPQSFGDRYSFIRRYLGGAFPIHAIEDEWRAQIERCLGRQLRLWFVNSHEHVHAIPTLFRLAQNLAVEYQIPFVRLPATDPAGRFKQGSWVRSVIVNVLRMINSKKLNSPTPRFVGLNESGNLSEAYLLRILDNVQQGGIYELMCHPGSSEARENCDNIAILRYHHWETELKALTSEHVQSVCQANKIRLVGYRDLLTEQSESTPSTK
jgi:hypothetical protein